MAGVFSTPNNKKRKGGGVFGDIAEQEEKSVATSKPQINIKATDIKPFKTTSQLMDTIGLNKSTPAPKPDINKTIDQEPNPVKKTLAKIGKWGIDTFEDKPAPQPTGGILDRLKAADQRREQQPLIKRVAESVPGNPLYGLNALDKASSGGYAVRGGIKAAQEGKPILKGMGNSFLGGLIDEEQNKISGEDITGLKRDTTKHWYNPKELGKDAINLGVDVVTDPTSLIGTGVGAKAVAKGRGLIKPSLSTVAREIEQTSLKNINKPIQFGEDAAKQAIKPPTFNEITQAELKSMEKSLPMASNNPLIDAVRDKTGLSKTPEQSMLDLMNKPKAMPYATEEVAASTAPKLNPLPDTTSQIVSSYQKEPISSKLSPRNIWEGMNKVYTKTVNDQRPIFRADEATGMLASNSRNAQGTVTHILNDNLVDRAGTAIDKPLKEVFKKLPKNKETEFVDYLLHRHNINRMVQEKPVFGGDITADISKAKIAQYEASNPEFTQLGNELNNWLNKFSNAWGVDSGMVSNELADTLREMYPNYVPTNRSFDEMEKAINYGAKKGYVNQTNGIKTATGSERPIINPIESIMRLVDRTVKTARYNEVGQSLLNAVRENPEKMSRWAEIIPTEEGLVDDINRTLADEGIDGVAGKFHEQYTPKNKATGTNIVKVMENGKPVQLRINDKTLLESLTGLNNSEIGPIETAARKITNPFKALITSDNPIFALRNIARDVPTAYVNGSVHNPFAFAKNYLGAYKDMLTNAKAFQEYKALGGGESNFFANDVKRLAETKDELLGKKKSILKKPLEYIRKFNNATETAPRYAEYKATVKRGGGTYESKQKGLFNANEITTNFNRSGRITKAVDSGVPYLNPGVQGLDKLARQFIKHPIATTAKGVVGVTAPTMALDYVNQRNPDYQKLDNRTKDNYFLIPKGDGTFFKIPKSRELGVLFGSLEQRILRAINGEKDSFKDFPTTVATNFSPANPIENNIASPLIYNIPKNKDFAGRSIVPLGITMDKRSPRYQYDEKTSEIAKKIGDIMNWSPKQIDYLIKSYTGVIGQLGLPLTTKGGNPVKAITNQFTADPMYSNNIVDDFYKNIDELSTKATDNNITNKIPSKTVTPEEKLRNKFNKASDEISKMRKKIALINGGNLPQDQKEAQTRALQQQIIDIANRTNSMIK